MIQSVTAKRIGEIIEGNRQSAGCPCWRAFRGQLKAASAVTLAASPSEGRGETALRVYVRASVTLLFDWIVQRRRFSLPSC